MLSIISTLSRPSRELYVIKALDLFALLLKVHTLKSNEFIKFYTFQRYNYLPGVRRPNYFRIH